MRKITHLCVWRSANQSPANGVSDGGGSSWNVELDENVAQVAVDGARADYQYFRHFAVGMALGNESQHFQFAPGEMEIKLIARM